MWRKYSLCSAQKKEYIYIYTMHYYCSSSPSSSSAVWVCSNFFPHCHAGVYSYLQPDGKELTVKYKASDHGGFQVVSKSEAQQAGSSAEQDLTLQYSPAAPEENMMKQSVVEESSFKVGQHQYDGSSLGGSQLVFSQPAPITYSYPYDVPSPYYYASSAQQPGLK
jgi:hypothetical protein